MRGGGRMTQGQLLRALGTLYPHSAMELVVALVTKAQADASRESSKQSRRAATAGRNQRIHDLRAAGKPTAIIRGIFRREGADLSVSQINRVLLQPRP